MRLLPWSEDADDDAHLLSLMLDVTRRVAALQDAVTDMRQENKLSYRQLKRQLLRLSQNDASRPTNFDSGHRSSVQSGIDALIVLLL